MFSFGYSLCGLCQSSARCTVAVRGGMRLFQGEVSNGDLKPVLFKAIR